MAEETFSVGLLTLRLAVGEAGSLTDKRRVIQSLKDGIRNRFNASVAEIGALDLHQSSVIGVAVAGNDGRYINSALSKIVEYVRRNAFAQIVDYGIEIV